MATERYETIIAARYEGMGVAQQVLRDLNQIGTGLENLERLGQKRSSAFAVNPIDLSQQQALLRTSIRDYDVLLQKVVKLRDAELARAQAHRTLNIPQGEPGSITDPVARERLDLRSRLAVDVAAKGLAEAYDRTAREVAREAESARRRALFGPLHETLLKPEGGLNFPARSDPQAKALSDAFARGRTEVQREEASLLKTRNTLLRQDVAQTIREIGAARRGERAAAEREEASLLKTRNNLLRQDVARGIKEIGDARRQVQKELAERERAAAREAAQREQNRIAIGRLHSARIARETKQLLADEEGARQRELYSNIQEQFPGADPVTRVGKAQVGINTAQLDLAKAELARAAILERGNPTAVQMINADKMVESATSRLAAARNTLAREEARQAIQNRSLLGRTQGQFMEGFRGASDRPYAEQIGQAFKFSVFYGTAYKLLFALTTTLQQTLQEGIEFQNAMTELKIASGLSAEAAADMAEGLGAQATAAGAAPSLGVTIGARSLGLFGATEAAGASQAEQDRVALISARVISRMALGSKTSPEELQTQVAAVANAFGGGAAGQIRAYDLDAYFARQFGINQGNTIQSVAESGTVGQAAGFDQEQVSAIAAYLQSRSGQSPSAVAGYMAQIFSRGGEGSLVSLGQRYGIDPNATLATQIRELAEVYKTASNTERAEIAAGFGRGKVQDAAIRLLEGFDLVTSTSDAARTDARGEGDRIFSERIKNIGGEIQLTVAALKAFASALSQSGVLDLLAVGVIAFRELVEAATSLLGAWNELPRAVRSTVAALALLAIAARTNAGASALGALGGLARGSAASRGVNLASVMAPYGGVAGGTGEAVRGAGGARSALASAGPWIAAAAGLYAIGELVSSTKEFKAAEESATSLMNSLAEGNSPDQYRARAAELQNQADISTEAAGGWINKVVPLLRGQASDARNDASEMESEAQRLEAAAKVIENAALSNTGRQGLITGFDDESLTASLDAITRSGGSASDRLRALDESLKGVANSAAAFNPELFAAQQGETLVGLLGDSITGIDGKSMTPKAVRDALGGYGGTPESAVELALRGSGIASADDIDLASATEAAKALVAKTEGTAGYVGTEEYNAAVEAVRDFILEQTRAARIMVQTAISLTPEEGFLLLQKTLAESQNVRGNLQETDYRGMVGNSRRLVRRVQRLINRTQGGGGDEFQVQLDLARRQLAEDQFNELENLRRAAQRNARSKAEVARIGQRFLRRELRSAIRNGNQDILTEIIGQAGAGAVRIARQIIQEVINTARAARQAFAAMLQARRAMQNALSRELDFARGAGASMSLPDDAVVPDAIKQMQNALGSMQTAAPGEDVYNLGSDVPGYEPPKEPKAGKSKEDRAAEREAARQEMLDLKNNLYLLSIDLTDPLAMATAAVKDARRRLASDIGSGQDKGTIAASRVALEQARNEREATAFQQRLDSVTTAEELGRISHQKYLSYLQNERRRLNAIKDRTFQQQQQLDQIDRLMKDAAEQMQGQWNFGDIKLPTPYQVRRQVEQMRVDRATQLDATSRQAASQATIYIDGADTGKVRQIINETLSKSNATVTNRPRRR